MRVEEEDTLRVVEDIRIHNQPEDSPVVDIRQEDSTGVDIREEGKLRDEGNDVLLQQHTHRD